MNETPHTEPPTLTETLSLQLRKDGILYLISRPGPPQSVEDARENLAIARKLAGGTRVPILLDIRNTGTLSRDARAVYVGQDGVNTVSGLAIVADNAFSRVVGSIFIRLAKTKYPVKLFGDDESAISWLEESRQ